MSKGFTIVEVLIVLAILAVLSAMAIPGLNQARVRAEIGAVVGDGRALMTAFKTYYVDQGQYPNASNPPAFDLGTFTPLTTEKYYRGNVQQWLVGNRADAYDSPDDGGANQEFWLEMTLSLDSTVRFVVANSNDAPLGGGQWLDGVYVYRNGQLLRM